MTEVENVVVVGFTEPSKAYQALSVLKECDAAGRIGLESAAIVERTEDGKLRIPESVDNDELAEARRVAEALDRIDVQVKQLGDLGHRQKPLQGRAITIGGSPKFTPSTSQRRTRPPSTNLLFKSRSRGGRRMANRSRSSKA